MLALLLLIVSIHDGDTIKLNGQSYRLSGIDAPELRQACQDASNKPYNCGQSAKDHLTTMIGRNEVACTSAGYRSYKRVVATCYIGEGDTRTDLGEAMVRDGQAVAYYTKKYQAQEMNARLNHRGIWAGKFITPHQWRRDHE